VKLGFIARNGPAEMEEDAAFAAEHGLAGLEFNYWKEFESLTPDTVSRMRAVLDKHGIEASALGLWGWNHISQDATERETSLGHLSRALDYAQTLGAKVLITGGGDIPEASLDEKAAEFAKIFAPFLERAAGAGIRIALYAVHGGSFFTSIEAYEKVWEKLQGVGIKFDPANVRHHGEDYIAWVRRHGDRMFHVHVKEHLYHDGDLASQPAAGMGDVKWGKVLAFLHEHGYDGYLSIEPHGPIWGRPPLMQKMILLSKRHMERFLL
jgi:sugar phosphate isomerase/epimerase